MLGVKSLLSADCHRCIDYHCRPVDRLFKAGICKINNGEKKERNETVKFWPAISIDGKTEKYAVGKDILCEMRRRISAVSSILPYNEGEADDNEHCYTFYQNIWTSQDAPVFQQRRMTNGITVLMPGLMGYECRKNSGHYHGLSQGHTSTLPEVYEVLCGKAVFLDAAVT